jgi:hypothetical protein
MNSFDDPELFRAKLKGGYDWLALPQGMAKRFKRRFLGSKKGTGVPAQAPEVSLN